MSPFDRSTRKYKKKSVDECRCIWDASWWTYNCAIW